MTVEADSAAKAIQAAQRKSKETPHNTTNQAKQLPNNAMSVPSLNIPELQISLLADETLKTHITQYVSARFAYWVLRGQLPVAQYDGTSKPFIYYESKKPEYLLNLYRTLDEWDENIGQLDTDIANLHIEVQNAIVDAIRIQKYPELTADQFPKQVHEIIYGQYDHDLYDFSLEFVEEISGITTKEAFAIGKEIAAETWRGDQMLAKENARSTEQNRHIATEVANTFFGEFTGYLDLPHKMPLITRVLKILPLLKQSERNALAEHGLPAVHFSNALGLAFKTWMKDGRIPARDQQPSLAQLPRKQ